VFCIDIRVYAGMPNHHHAVYMLAKPTDT